jgi:hypothetical protein
MVVGERIQIATLEHEQDTRVLTIYQGISEEHVERVILYANTDELIIKFTSDSKRFKDKEAFTEWLKKDRTVYTLTDPVDELLGIIWFGKREFPEASLTEPVVTDDYPFTFSIRLYAIARGKHLSSPFMEVAFIAFSQTSQYVNSEKKGFWLDTPVDNIPAIKTYQKFGFETVSNPGPTNEIVMVLPKIPDLIA